jgi:dihydroflavonol-4-reductase
VGEASDRDSDRVGVFGGEEPSLHTVGDRVLEVAGGGAGECVRELAEHGYAARGTVRRPGSVRHLRSVVELVVADLESDRGWEEAVDGCRYVLHAASPFPLEDPDDVLLLGVSP